VWSDRVVDAPIVSDLGGKGEAISDFAAVEPLVFDGSEEPLL
jgi:hypothetical protein